MRITTSAIIRDYKANLSASINNLNVSRTHVMTQRSFNSTAEDPASAARASQLHRKYYKNQDNLKMLEEVQARQDGQEDALRQISDMVKNISKNYNIQALNGTNQTKEVRQSYASAIRQFQQSMVLSLNSSYEETFLFAGSDGKNSPFELTSDGTLNYRGIDVNSAKGSADYDKLKTLSNENLYVDLGMGLSMDDFDQVVSSSAFNMSLPGINAIGYGVDEKGMSNNIVVMAGKLADSLEAETFDADQFRDLMNKFDTLGTNLMNQITELGVKSEFLTTTKDRLDNADISIQEQMSGVEGVDMAEAITNYMWDQYAYNSALKVGTSILSSSFIDFMR
ncbi:flagellin [Clostridium boliviensis]|uniref:Flagellin n=1 Tax=Clostridium boliviensis TaxID=318465 RepID=A0ABU4GKG3_9CLOT|nr:flagellin [Clostridium boliviensis]MDW2798110.1 flagellin [Clostridium boliviensis]